MIRRIIQINEEKCNGCGACASACHEGAIGMVNGKAKLLRDDYCDGLGDCLPTCPTGAITFIEREAAAYDEAAVKAAQLKASQNGTAAAQPHTHSQNDIPHIPCGCPGTHIKQFSRTTQADMDAEATRSQNAFESFEPDSQLSQWPVQIKLVPTRAPYFQGARLLIAADCTAYAYANFHSRFIKNRITLIGCPKLDSINYAEKLTEILRENDIQSVTVVRMEVPCCGGIEQAVKTALASSGKLIPWHVEVISTDGRILSK